MRLQLPMKSKMFNLKMKHAGDLHYLNFFQEALKTHDQQQNQPGMITRNES
jgi:hypothetical protein